MDIGFGEDFAEERLDAAGADAGPGETCFTDGEEIVATIGVKGTRAAEGGADRGLQFVEVFAAAED